MNTNSYLGYKEPKVVVINKSCMILVYKPINKNKDTTIIEIYNNIQNTYITLYNTTLYRIYSLLTTKKKIKNKRKSSSKKKLT